MKLLPVVIGSAVVIGAGLLLLNSTNGSSTANATKAPSDNTAMGAAEAQASQYSNLVSPNRNRPIAQVTYNSAKVYCKNNGGIWTDSPPNCNWGSVIFKQPGNVQTLSSPNRFVFAGLLSRKPNNNF